MNKLEGKRTLVRARSRRESNDILYLKGIGWKGQDWVELAQNLYLLFFSSINENVAAVGNYDMVGSNMI